MIKIKWKQQLSKNIDKVFFSECHDALAVVHEDLRTLSFFSIASKEVLWVHVFNSSVIQDVHFHGDWLLVKYGGGKSGWMRLNVTNGDATRLDELKCLDRIVYVTARYAVFVQNRGESYAQFDISSGEINQVDTEDMMPFVVMGSSERYFAWQEVDSKYKMIMGKIDPEAGIPLREGGVVFSPEKEGEEFGVISSNLTDFSYLLDGKCKKYEWYTWQGERTSTFQLPKAVVETHSFITQMLYFKDGIDYAIMIFSLQKEQEVVICNYNLGTGDLVWERMVKSPRNGSGFAIGNDYLIHATGAEGLKVGGKGGGVHHQNESLQINLMTGEINPFQDELIGHWLCSTGNGVFFNPLSKGKKCLAYGEF